GLGRPRCLLRGCAVVRDGSGGAIDGEFSRSKCSPAYARCATANACAGCESYARACGSASVARRLDD
ncbi:MAG TPA: hypothetical protein VIK01_18970, partial [Polyangiaceae bacterium]